MNEFKAYVGYVDGKPHVEDVLDEYGAAYVLAVYRNKRDACRRYQDVRAVTVKVGKTVRRVRPEGKSASLNNEGGSK